MYTIVLLGKTFTLADNANFSGSGVTVGSAFVKPDCSLYLFKNNDFTAPNPSSDMYHYNILYSIIIKSFIRIKVENENVLVTWPGSNGAVSEVGSMKCRCKQKPVSCTPEDEYEVRNIFIQ